MASKSKSLVGSSSNKISGLPNSACASSTLTRCFGMISSMVLSKSSLGTFKPYKSFSAFDSASQPSSSANSYSKSAS